MISPTGLGIRSDGEGDGHYGAPRGRRLHNGVDYICVPGQDIVAPFDMTILREAWPYKDLTLSGIAWRYGNSEGRMFYFQPHDNVIGKDVKQRQSIGFAQSVSAYYKSVIMTDHIHFQINK